MNKWVPDQKWLAGGIGGVATWGVLLLMQQLGVTVPSGLEAVIPTLVTMLVHYAVPAADQDVIKRLNDRIVAMAAADPTSEVNAAAKAAVAVPVEPAAATAQ